MLTLDIADQESYNEATGEFYYVHACTLQLEHSLISLSKWESKWKVPFTQKLETGLTRAELVDYVRCMTINQKVDPKIYATLTMNQLQKVQDYITDPATATKIYDHRPNKGGGKQIITSELIYWQMIYLGIPFECEKWHLNRLLTLIRVCSIKGTSNPMTEAALLNQNKQLNAARRAAMNSRG